MKPFLNWNNLISSLFMFNYSWWYKIQTLRETKSSLNFISHFILQNLSTQSLLCSREQIMFLLCSSRKVASKNLPSCFNEKEFGWQSAEIWLPYYLALYMLNDWLKQENKLLKSYWEQQLGTPEVRVMQKQKTYRKRGRKFRVKTESKFEWVFCD